MATFRHVRAGESLANLSASDYNAALDAARAHRERERGIGRTDKPEFRQGDIVLVRNDSGVNAPRFGVLALDAPIIDPGDNAPAFKNQVAFSGIKPLRKNHLGKFAVLLEPLDNGKTGLGQVSGVTVALVVLAASNHRYADVGDDQVSALQSGNIGSAQILWHAPSGDLAVVRLGCAPQRRFDAKLGAESSGSGGSDAEEISANRWRYSFTERVRLGDDWVEPAAPVTGTALNRTEEPNDGSDVEGTGATVGEEDGVVQTLLPADEGEPVVEITADFDANGDEVFSFSFENELDVECSGA